MKAKQFSTTLLVLIQLFVSSASAAPAAAVPIEPELSSAEAGKPFDEKRVPAKRAKATTWDGRLAFDCDASLTIGYSPKFCYARVFQPLVAVSGNSGIPNLRNSWSDDVKLVGSNNLPIVLTSEMNIHLSATMNPVAQYPNGNPYRSNVDGTAEALGEYEFYQVMIVSYTAQVSRIFDGRYTAAQANVIVHAFDSVNGKLVRKEKPTIVKFQTPTGFLTMTAGGRGIQDFEPALTADGRLMFGNKAVYRTNNYVPKNNASDFRSFIASWSGPKATYQLFNENAEFKKKYPLAQVVWKDALGRPCNIPQNQCGGSYPWISPDGSELFFNKGDMYSIGTQLEINNFFMVGPRTGFQEVNVDGYPNTNRYSTIGTIQAVGGVTGSMWHQFPEVSALAPLPMRKRRPVYPMFKNAYAEIDLVPFNSDYRVYLPMNELLTGKGQAFSSGPEYRMEEGKWVRIYTTKPISHKLTPDVSGNFHTGLLNDGAHFPLEYLMAHPGTEFQDEAVGLVGRGVFLQPNGAVQLRSTQDENINPNASAPHTIMADHAGFTMEVAFRVLRNYPDKLNLVDKVGLWTLFRERGGRLGVSFKQGGGRELTFMTQYNLAVSPKFHHITLMVSHRRPFLNIYVNGKLIYRNTDSQLLNTSSKLANAIVIGPKLAVGANEPAVLIVDEFGYANRLRRDLFIAERFGESTELAANTVTVAALQKQKVALPSELVPPLGLDAGEMRIPTELVEIISKGQFSALVQIGDKAFHDANITGHNISCNTCHNSEQNFIDTRRDPRGGPARFSEGAVAGTVGPRHTPVAFNRAFSTEQFYDGRSKDLLAQVSRPLFNPIEMAGTPQDILRYLRDPSRGYVADFAPIFAERVTIPHLSMALTAYLLTQMRADSNVDKVMNGVEVRNLNQNEVASIQRGLALFNGKAQCIACHSGSNFTDEQYHNTGTVVDAQGAILDRGRGAISGLTKDLGAVKTPTLRQISETAPYFSNARTRTLEEVVVFYEKGGIQNPHLDAQMIPFTLTQQERADLVFFLKNL